METSLTKEVEQGSKIQLTTLPNRGQSVRIKKEAKLKRAIIYTRVSTEEQAEKASLDQQETACRDFAVKNDLEIVQPVFREEGESAKTANRTKLLELIAYCRKNKGKVDYLIFYKVDRLARQAGDHLAIKATLLAVGVRLRSVTEPIDDSTSGKLMETVLAGFAQFDNDVRSERCSNGMLARVEEGAWPFTAPVGYRNVKDAQDRPTLEPDDQAPMVRKLLLEFKRGLFTQKEAADKAYAYGIRSRKGNRLSQQAINTMLRNPVYAGKVVSKMIEGTREGLHEGLISAADHDSIIGVLTGRKRVYQPNSRGRPEWPLRDKGVKGGFLRCGRCEARITGSCPTTGGGQPSPRYGCPKCHASAGNPVSKKRELMHEDFESLLTRIRPTDGTLKLYRDVVLRRWNEEHKDAVLARKRIDAQLTMLEDRRSVITTKYVDGGLTLAEKEQQHAMTDSLLLDLRLKRDELRTDELNKEAIVDYGINFMANAAKLWRDSDLENRQRFQKMVLPDGILYFFGEGFGTLNLGLSYQLNEEIAENSDELSTLVDPTGFEPVTSSTSMRRSSQLS